MRNSDPAVKGLERRASGRAAVAWLLTAGLVLGFILVPFALWDAELTAWSRGLLSAESARPVVAAAVVLLLAADIPLPIPSSLVSTAAGLHLGFAAGAAASWLGMTAGCLIAYLLGSRLGRPAVEKMVGPAAWSRVGAAVRRHGAWSIAAFRPVPVLAEASVLLAGLGAMPIRRFAVVAMLANLGVSLVYAGVGAWAAETGAFLLAFAAAMAVPGLAMALARWHGRS